MRNFTLLFCLIIFCIEICFAQNVGINTSNPHANALLDIKGINKGLLIPRGDASTRTTLSSNTAKGLMLCDTTTNTIWMHNGNGLMSGWQSLSIGANYWIQSGVLGTEIKNTNTGGFWSANGSTVLSDPGAIAPPVSGAGSRLMWIPQKSAFRAGTVDNTQWNADSIGTWSASIGVNTVAKGPYSLALGNTTTASGVTSTAMGYATRASGENAISTGSVTTASGIVSTAMGYSSIASGQFSVAIGASVIASNTSSTALGNGTNASGAFSTALGAITTASGETSTAMGLSSMASGTVSTAMGYNTNASGAVSTAMGNSTIASGLSSTAIGYSTKASGENAIAMGSVTVASGANSTSIGFDTYARSYGSVAMGRWNDSIAISSKTSWVGADPLLILGNGASAGNRHNALVVYKNGNVVLKNPTPVVVDPGALPLPVSGAGTRMMWLPEKSAFRAGTVEGTQWDDIGTGSFAGGTSTSASGRDATAFGNSTSAYGFNATAMGYGSAAGGTISTALGFATSATGEWSLSTGASTKAQGLASTAIGYANTASSNYSTAMGLHNIARGFASTVVGRYCDPIFAMNETEVSEYTPLFLVGNGYGVGEGERSNAMIVTAAGRVGIGTNTPITTFDMDAGLPSLNHSFMVRGEYYVAGSVANIGAGSRMTYSPSKGVFRAGVVGGTQWDDINTGEFSVAFGVNTIASGYRSFAAGDHAVASGTGSFALGYYCKALGGNSIAFGGFTKAEGGASSVSGSGTIAKSALETVIGQYNDTLLLTDPNPLAWESNDALFVVGNGTTPYVGDRHNAFVIYKNGNTEVNGNLTIEDTLKITGFTSLGTGAPKIKMKKLAGTSATAQNMSVNVAHGLTMSKIISVDILLSVTGFNLPPSYTYNSGYEYQYYISTTSIVVINSAANSGSILTKPFTILITYEE